MALIQLTLLNRLLFQHPDRIFSRRAVEWALAAQLGDRYLDSVDRLILRHSSERVAREPLLIPPPLFEVPSLTLLHANAVSMNWPQRTKRPVGWTSDAYCTLFNVIAA